MIADNEQCVAAVLYASHRECAFNDRDLWILQHHAHDRFRPRRQMRCVFTLHLAAAGVFHHGAGGLFFEFAQEIGNRSFIKIDFTKQFVELLRIGQRQFAQRINDREREFLFMRQ